MGCSLAVSAVVLASMLVACTRSTISVSGRLEGPADPVVLTIPNDPRPRPKLLVDESSSVPMDRLSIVTQRTGAAPGEGYIFLTFQRSRPQVGGSNFISTDSAGDLNFLRQHTGPLLYGSYFWYEDPPDIRVNVSANENSQSGATYLARLSTGLEDRVFMRWSEPDVFPLPLNVILGRRSEPGDLEDFPELQAEVQTCIDNVLAEAENNPPSSLSDGGIELIVEIDRCGASPSEVAEAFGTRCFAARPCLDMQSLSNALFIAVSNAITSALDDSDPKVELGGLRGDGDFKLTFIPHVTGPDNQQGIGFIFEGTVQAALGTVTATISGAY